MLILCTSYTKQSRNSVEIKNTLTRAASAGFSYIHWCNEFGGSSYIYSVYEMLQIKDWCRELGLSVKGVHAADGEKNSDLKNYLSTNEYNRLAGLYLLKNRIDLAHILNTDAIVLHFKFPWERIEQDNDCIDVLLQLAFRTFDELEGYCKTRGVKICIENTSGIPAECNPIFDTLFKRYDSGYMEFCFDTGHAVLNCKGNYLEYAQRYYDRLFYVHLHDNLGDRDNHILPFEGNFDWEGFAQLLARSSRDYSLVIESSIKGEADSIQWLKEAFNTGNRFIEMVEKHRS